MSSANGLSLLNVLFSFVHIQRDGQDYLVPIMFHHSLYIKVTQSQTKLGKLLHTLEALVVETDLVLFLGANDAG